MANVLPIEAFGLAAGHTTFGHRFLHPGTLKVKEPAGYLDALRKAHVVADPNERRRRWSSRSPRRPPSVVRRVVADDELTDIVNYLVEWPTAITGGFGERYLDLPREVIVTALREHQRFFAVEKPMARCCRASSPCAMAMRRGSTRAQGQRGRARRAPGRRAFYWDTDLKHKPSELVDKLSGVVWMEGLGSLREKATRLESLSGWLGGRLDAPHVRQPCEPHCCAKQTCWVK